MTEVEMAADGRSDFLPVLRVGRKVGRTLYLQLGPDPSDDDPLVGMMDTRELAAEVAGSAARCVLLVRQLEETRAALRRAAYVAEHLHAMIDQDTWRATGGDDAQGHYEGDWRAEETLLEIRGWAALGVVLQAAGTAGNDNLGGEQSSPCAGDS